MTSKLMLALCVIAACTMSGQAMAWSAERHCRQLAAAARAVRMLKIQIVSRLEPLERALLMTDFVPFEEWAKELASGKNDFDVKKNACCKKMEDMLDCLSDGELRCLNQMFEKLGRSGRETQRETLNACITELETAQAEAGDRARKVSKLYATIGFLSGITIVILTI